MATYYIGKDYLNYFVAKRFYRDTLASEFFLEILVFSPIA